jgi:acrylyl-CoA reductase (NADPH)
MADRTFQAMVVRESANGEFTRQVEDRTIDDLPAGDVLIRVHYSSLNYKDALSASGNRGVTKKYPHTPGIDAAGVVRESTGEAFQPGDKVLVTGYDLGMNTPGGFGQYIRVPAAWVVRLPEHLTWRESMIYGTAGFTAALSVYKLEGQGIPPDQGEILVTGATGGVGSLAVSILARDGYQVVAATGKPEAAPYLLDLGARRVIPRDQALDTSSRALLSARWAAVVDTVGGEYLVTALKAVQYGGVVTCCGNVASAELVTTVYPFILRGVSLLGIDSVNCPPGLRWDLWQKLGSDWKLPFLERIASERTLADLNTEIDRILKGQQQGRVVVNLAPGDDG